MSDNPTKSFKDFIGWIFAGGAVVILSLVTMIYSSMTSRVEALDLRAQIHAERIKGAEGEIQGIRETLRRIEDDVREIKKRVVEK